MARPLRIEYKGVFYHKTSRGNERRRICFVLIQGLTLFFFFTKKRFEPLEGFSGVESYFGVLSYLFIRGYFFKGAWSLLYTGTRHKML
jgi:hypothetical protein